MLRVHLNLYSGFCNYRGYKFARVLSKFYDLIYLSGSKNRNSHSSYSYDDIKSYKNIKALYLKNYNYFVWTISHIFFFKEKNLVSISIHNLRLIPMGVILKFIFKAKLIYEPHELETETVEKKNINKFISKLIEKIFIKYFDEIIVVSPSIAEWYKRKYKIKRPLVIYNSRKFDPVEKKNYFREKFNINNKSKIFLYVGNLNKRGRGIDLIINTFLNENFKNNVVIFMGKGNAVPSIIEASKKNQNIYYHSSVSTNEINYYTSSADIGLCLIENTCLNENYCLPNKLFEYLSGGIPVIVSNLKELKNFINQNQCGYIFNLKNNNLTQFIEKNITENLLKIKTANVHKTNLKFN